MEKKQKQQNNAAIKSAYYGQFVRVVDINGKIWEGKVSYIEGPEESYSGEIELGIDYAGGITVFAQSELASLKILE